MSVELAERSAEYIASDYCFSCAYFKQEKGHFGTCADMGPKTPYDGTKQGSACAGWRKKTAWGSVEFKLPETIIRVPPLKKGLFSQLGSLISGEKYKQIHPSPKLARFTGRRGLVKNYHIPPCPYCGGVTVRHGHYDDGEQRYKCKGCDRNVHGDGIFVDKSKLTFNDGERRLKLIVHSFRNYHAPFQKPDKAKRDATRAGEFIATLAIPESGSVRVNQCLSKHPQNVIKHGIRYVNWTPVQRYTCKLCHTRFSAEQHQYVMTKQILLGVLKAWAEGKSLREIAAQFKPISFMTAYNWILSYSKWKEEN